MQKLARVFACCMLLFLLVLCGSYLFGQATATGTVQGTVTDKSQAVVVGAQVTITSKATGATRNTTTNDTGAYRFDLMPAGTYQVKVMKEGFRTVVQTVEVLVGQSSTVSAALEPGAATQVVEVSAVAPIVDLTKTSVSQDITPTEVAELPLLGRDAANLA
jgi:Carboxypeptidase regulatory-like domain